MLIVYFVIFRYRSLGGALRVLQYPIREYNMSNNKQHIDL